MHLFPVGGSSSHFRKERVNKRVVVVVVVVVVYRDSIACHHAPYRFIFDCYRLSCLIVSLLSAFKGGKGEEGKKERRWRRKGDFYRRSLSYSRQDERRTSPLSPFSRFMQKVRPVCASLRSSRFLWRVQLPWNRGSRPRCEIAAVLGCPNLLSFRANFSRCFDPRSTCLLYFFFFFSFSCARRFLFSPQLSRIGWWNEGSWSRTKEMISIFASHAFERFFFLSFVVQIYRAINHVDTRSCFMLLCLFFQFLPLYEPCISLISFCLYTMHRSDSQQFFKIFKMFSSNYRYYWNF